MKLPPFRFGLLTLFSLMLIAISAAGWVRERWGIVEEQEILDALVADGLTYDLTRSFAANGNAGELDTLVLYGDPSNETMEKICASRSLRRIEVRPPGRTVREYFDAIFADRANVSLPSPTPAFEAIARIDAPEFDSATFDEREPAELSPGSDVSDAEREEILSQTLAVWRSAEEAMGSRWIAACCLYGDWHLPPQAPRVHVVEGAIRDRERFLTFDRDGCATICLHAPEGDLRIDFAKGLWRTVASDRSAVDRRLGSSKYEANRLRPPFAGPIQWRRLLDDRAADELFKEVVRLDDGTYRLHIQPIEFDREPRDPTDLPIDADADFLPVSRVASGFVVVDPGLDWAIVNAEFDLGFPDGEVAYETHRERIDYERIAGRYVPTRRQERVSLPTRRRVSGGDGRSSVFPGGSWSETTHFGREDKAVQRFHWDFDPEIPSEVLSLDHWSVPALRVRRSHLFPWYWSTLSLGGFGILFAFVRHSRDRRQRNRPSFPELDEPAAPL